MNEAEMLKVIRNDNVSDDSWREYFDAMSSVKPTYAIEIPSGGPSISDHLLELMDVSKGCGVIALGDSDICDMLPSKAQEIIEQDLIGRLRSGSLNADFDGDPGPGYHDLPEGFRKRIEAIIEKRQKVLNQRIVWFTYRVNELNETWVDFPVVAYRFGHPPTVAMANPCVEKAINRLRRRGNVKAIKVVGPVPQHWYQGPMEQL